jgi:hypothetical protein
MELHRYVAWWTAPELKGAQTMFLVKLLGPVRQWRPDGFTYRAVGSKPVQVRVCDHRVNKGHPACGETFRAEPRDLVAVQYGYQHN